MPVPHLNTKKFLEALKVCLSHGEIRDEYGTPLTTEEFLEKMETEGLDDVTSSTIEAFQEKTKILPAFHTFRVGKYRCCSSNRFS